MFKWAQRIARILIVSVTVTFLTFAIITAWYVFGFHSSSRLTPPEVAFWMQHSWVTAEHENFVDLAHELDALPASSLYFHVGPINEDGTLADDLEIKPANFNTLPSTNYAWLGQIRSKIELSDPEVRATIISSAEWLLDQGFDGIHLDIEPIRPDDTDFPLLVQEMNAALPGTPISVAMDEWQPDLITQMVANWYDVSIVSYWSSEQVVALMPYVDEFVVMTYDTGFHDPAFFSWWVEQQTIALSKLMDDDTKLLIALPVYSEGSNFDPEAENIETGLVGYTRGLTNLRSNSDSIDGIALYPYWEMDEAEWQVLKTYLDYAIDIPESVE
ncbi:MAG: hypothetical protein ACI9QC_000664 [Oceanicoccus sp.]|jgi:hypothetical protein